MLGLLVCKMFLFIENLPYCNWNREDILINSDYKKYYNNKMEIVTENLINKKCITCNKEFKCYKHSGQINCSKKCSEIDRKRKIAMQPFKRGYSNIPNYRIFERDTFTCIYCGKSSIEDNIKLHIDHIYPLSKGGSNNIDNLVTSCKYCNISKNASLNKELIERVKNIVKERNKKMLFLEN